MIKSLEIFKKKKSIITIICILLIVIFSLFLLTSPITSNSPTDNFYISIVSEENKIHRGTYNWKYMFGVIMADSIEPLEYAKSINTVKYGTSEKVSIVKENNNFKNIKQIDVIELENNINVLSINNFTNTSKIEFTSPDIIGTYYYLIKVYYQNESYVEYVFALEVIDNEESIVDDTQKIAKLNELSDWNDETKEYKVTYIKEISEKEIESINKIIERGKKFLGTISWASIPDYEILFNNEEKNKIDIRIADNTINIEEHDKSLSVCTIYAEDDVKYLLNLLGRKNKYVSMPVINLDEYRKPMDIYLLGINKLELGTYDWKIPNNLNNSNDKLSNFIAVDSIPPKEILKNKKAFSLVSTGTYITINSQSETNNKKLPQETNVMYKIYKVDENGLNAEYKEATRMIDGSYYFSELPKIKGEYIIEIYMSFGKLSNNSANYCAKIEV